MKFHSTGTESGYRDKRFYSVKRRQVPETESIKQSRSKFVVGQNPDIVT